MERETGRGIKQDRKRTKKKWRGKGQKEGEWRCGVGEKSGKRDTPCTTCYASVSIGCRSIF